MSREFRRMARDKKIAKRKRIIEAGGLQGGSLYEKHRDKIEKNSGYLDKHGTILHYGCGTKHTQGKVRDRNSYDGTNNWKHRDIKQMDDMDQQMNEINLSEDIDN